MFLFGEFFFQVTGDQVFTGYLIFVIIFNILLEYLADWKSLSGGRGDPDEPEMDMSKYKDTWFTGIQR